jgi:hypothetical protein
MTGRVPRPRERSRPPSTSGVLVIAGTVLLVLGAVASACAAQEIAPFRLTGTEGHLSTRFVRDGFSTRAPGGRSRQGQSDVRQEVFLMTHSYVYHPNFLTLDIGGGPVLQYGQSFTDTRETEAVRPLYTLTGRATFLREKPYRGSLFYEHLNPVLSVSPGEVLVQESTRYGAELALLAPVTPVPLQIDASRSLTDGRSADRVVDDRIDQVNVRATRSLGGIGSTRVHLQALEQASRSGSPNLPIQATSFESHSLDADTRVQLGAPGRYDLVNLVTLNHQRYALDPCELAARTDARVVLDARARPWDRLQTFGTYAFSAGEQGQITSELHSLAAGLSYQVTDTLTATLGVHGDQNRTSELSSRSRGADGSIRYERPLLFGVVQAGYAVRHDVRDQQAAGPQANVIGERVTLAGTTMVALSRPRVVPGSVVVSSVARTQTFTGGRDYALTVVGLETRLQRLIGGNLLDGQEVLVDYAYDTGRTFASTQLDQTFTLGWTLSPYLNLYYRRIESAPTVTSGTPSSPLNTVHADLFGVRSDLPLKLGVPVSVGGGYEQELRRETIAPYRRDALDVYAQNDDLLFDTTTIRIGARRTWLEYDRSAQDVDLVGYDVRLAWRHPLGVDVSAEASYEEDVGGLVPRSMVASSVRVQWAVRKLTLGLDFGLTHETQGSVERQRSLVQFLLRRDL